MDREAGGQGASLDMPQEAASPTKDGALKDARAEWISPAPSA